MIDRSGRPPPRPARVCLSGRRGDMSQVQERASRRDTTRTCDADRLKLSYRGSELATSRPVAPNLDSTVYPPSPQCRNGTAAIYRARARASVKLVPRGRSSKRGGTPRRPVGSSRGGASEERSENAIRSQPRPRALSRGPLHLRGVPEARAWLVQPRATRAALEPARGDASRVGDRVRGAGATAPS